MPKQRLLFLILILSLALVLSALVWIGLSPRLDQQPDSNPGELKVLEIPKENAPQFQWIPLTSLGGPITDPRPPRHGGATLILFWASWCYPCWQELEVLVETEDRLKDLGLKVVPIGVAMNQGHIELAEETWEKLQLPFPMQWDAGEFYQTRHSLEGLPQSLLLDSRDNVRRQLIGSLPLAPKKLISFLKEHIAFPESDKPQLEKPQQ